MIAKQKRYGGVHNGQTIDQIQEAEAYVKPPIRYSTPQIIFKIAFYAVICASAIVVTILGIGWILFSVWSLFNYS